MTEHGAGNGNVDRVTRLSHLDALASDDLDPRSERDPPSPAEAALEQYELAAIAFDELGGEVRERIAGLQQALDECEHDLRLLAEGAKTIREKGSLVRAQIAEVADLSGRARSLCSEFSER